MAIELVPLCTMRLQGKPAVEVGVGPAGTRLIVDCISVQVEGDRLCGQMEGRTTGDWILIGPEGTGTLDVRETLRTDDGAIIYVQYHGRLDGSHGLKPPLTVYVAPRFETGDERYAWLRAGLGELASRSPGDLARSWRTIRELSLSLLPACCPAARNRSRSQRPGPGSVLAMCPARAGRPGRP